MGLLFKSNCGVETKLANTVCSGKLSNSETGLSKPANLADDSVSVTVL